MTRRLLAILALSVAAAAPVAAHAQLSTSIIVSGGLSVPVSDLADGVNSGYNVNVGLGLGAPFVPVGARFEGGFSSFDAKGGNGTSRIASGTANAVLHLGPTGAAPYLIGGLGIYNLRREVTAGTLRVTDTYNKAGVNVGGGIRFPLGGISTFLEARYHYVLGDDATGTKVQYVPISFGVAF